MITKSITCEKKKKTQACVKKDKRYPRQLTLESSTAVIVRYHKSNSEMSALIKCHICYLYELVL